jgi:hypothetical protein
LRNKKRKVDGGFSCQFKRLKAEFDSLRQHLTKLPDGMKLQGLIKSCIASPYLPEKP